MNNDEIENELIKLLDEKQKILFRIEPLRRKESALQESADQINQKLSQVREKIVSIEQPRLPEISRRIAELTRISGKAKASISHQNSIPKKRSFLARLFHWG